MLLRAEIGLLGMGAGIMWAIAALIAAALLPNHGPLARCFLQPTVLLKSC
jgi:hypothetical protein